MEITTNRFANVATSVLAMLWFYACVSKLIEFDHFKSAMHKQTIWPVLQLLLIYGLLPVEIITGILLIINKTVIYGLYASAYLFLLFIIYIILVLAKIFGKVPCSCGGLIEHMGWTFHLFFNIAVLTMTLFTIFFHQRKERGDTQ